jgi:hypothetical protein
MISRKKSFSLMLKPLAFATLCALGGTAEAIQFNWEDAITGSVDTTLSYGVAVRASKRDINLYGIANGGNSRSVNEDDGDLNYDNGKLYSNLAKASMDVEAKWKNWGVFLRGYGFYDYVNARDDKLGPIGTKDIGKNWVGLDGFVSAAFEPMDKNLRLRFGRQSISWGESTFIPGGINIISPVDVARLRTPGAEVKEAQLVTTGIWASQELSSGTSIEGFYLTNWNKNKIDPRGSYFSNNDTVSDDSNQVIVSFGRRQDQHFPPSNPVPPGIPTLSAAASALYGPYNPAASIWVQRANDHDPSDNGQYGVAFRYLAKELNNSEFGFYFINYHSRSPFVSGIKGTTTSVLTGGPLIAPICATPALRSLCATGTAKYFADFPEDIKLYGVSFNTPGPYGIAFQGEYSYRPNLPVQYASAEVILATLGLPNLLTGYTQIPGAPAGATAASLVPDGTTITGYQRLKASQFQTTATKSWPGVLSAENFVLVGEVGFNYFHGLPSDVKFSGPATYLPATQFGAVVSGANAVQQTGFLTNFSWGYRLVGRLEYADALFSGNLSPRLAWAQDVDGVGPNFNQGVKSWAIGLAWDYQRKWLVDLQYTGYYGGRTYCGTDVPGSGVVGQPASWCSDANPLKDRDFYSFSVSYSF